MRNFLQEVQWDREMVGKSVNEMMEYVATKCKEAEERFVPKGNRNNRKTKTSLWFTRRCREAKTKCNREWKRYRRHRTQENKEISRRARNEYAQIRREAQRQYENDIASKVKSDPKLLYSHIRRKTTVRDQVIRLRKEGGELTRNDQEVCEELNTRFKEVFTVETGRTLGGQIRWGHQQGIHQQVLDDIHTDEEEVKKLLRDIDTSKAMGPDNISPWVLREGADMLCVPLTTIFNTSLETGQLPEVWKTANIVPIFKKGDRKEALNYRPVSLTCIVCKVMEKIIRRRVVEHLERNKSINANQHGFMEGKSCVTNLLEFYDKITEVRHEREGWADCIFLDCKKAFDTVPHKRLVQKLEHQAHITGRALQWIREYLTGRQHRVMVRNDVSQWAPVTSGVPQGSVLGPVLFLVYVNDMMEGLYSEVSLFADDVKLMRRIKSDEDQAGLQRDLDRLDTWSNKWLLEFNPAKCKVMKIGEGHRRPQTEYRLGGQRLQTSLKEKDLGVSITPSMSPEAHINQITAAAYGRLANLRTAFRYLSKESFKTLYTVYVRPILEYAAPVWNPHLIKHVKKLEKVQRFATRLVPELRGMSYEERLREIGLTTLEDRRVRGDMITTYKILRGIDKVDKDRMF
ncbi:hypothetical protein OTU49_016085 [Cherax quadricarinatus]|uniref:Reverse transcriptase domain-containing protein n=1 Tax=Cherax quadricarinatus TaxID=27406 RepID=A0AAW0XUV7_CHEQU